jgi:cell fate (sporulation/competence/biofilm development) regulator YlbF (YheA/YmcA/DUF963 family)
MQESTRTEVMKAAKAFGKALAGGEAYAAIASAEESLKHDREAQDLLRNYQIHQRAVQMAQMWQGSPRAEDLDALTRLETQINAHQIIQTLFEAQKKLQTTVDTLNTEISSLLGIDFASNSRAGGCC